MIPDQACVRCTILSYSCRGVPLNSVTETTAAATVVMSSSVCRRLQFDDVDDRFDSSGQQKSSRELSETVSETVSDVIERLYDDQAARWNMDFRTLTPLNGGRWRWTAVDKSPSLTSVDGHVAADEQRSSSVCRNVAMKHRRRKITGQW